MTSLKIQISQKNKDRHVANHEDPVDDDIVEVQPGPSSSTPSSTPHPSLPLHTKMNRYSDAVRIIPIGRNSNKSWRSKFADFRKNQSWPNTDGLHSPARFGGSTYNCKHTVTNQYSMAPNSNWATDYVNNGPYVASRHPEFKFEKRSKYNLDGRRRNQQKPAMKYSQSKKAAFSKRNDLRSNVSNVDQRNDTSVSKYSLGKKSQVSKPSNPLTSSEELLRLKRLKKDAEEAITVSGKKLQYKITSIILKQKMRNKRIVSPSHLDNDVSEGKDADVSHDEGREGLEDLSHSQQRIETQNQTKNVETVWSTGETIKSSVGLRTPDFRLTNDDFKDIGNGTLTNTVTSGGILQDASVDLMLPSPQNGSEIVHLSIVPNEIVSIVRKHCSPNVVPKHPFIRRGPIRRIESFPGRYKLNVVEQLLPTKGKRRATKSAHTDDQITEGELSTVNDVVDKRQMDSKVLHVDIDATGDTNDEFDDIVEVSVLPKPLPEIIDLSDDDKCAPKHSDSSPPPSLPLHDMHKNDDVPHEGDHEPYHKVDELDDIVEVPVPPKPIPEIIDLSAVDNGGPECNDLPTRPSGNSEAYGILTGLNSQLDEIQHRNELTIQRKVRSKKAKMPKGKGKDIRICSTNPCQMRKFKNFGALWRHTRDKHGDDAVRLLTDRNALPSGTRNMKSLELPSNNLERNPLHRKHEKTHTPTINSLHPIERRVTEFSENASLGEAGPNQQFPQSNDRATAQSRRNTSPNLSGPKPHNNLKSQQAFTDTELLKMAYAIATESSQSYRHRIPTQHNTQPANGEVQHNSSDRWTEFVWGQNFE